MDYIVDLTSPFIWVFFLGSALQIIWNSWLSWRERDFVLKTEDEACTKLQELHSLAKDTFTEEKLKRSLSYERTSNAFSLFHGKCNRIIQGGILLFGLIPWLFSILLSSVGLPLLCQQSASQLHSIGLMTSLTSHSIGILLSHWKSALASTLLQRKSFGPTSSRTS